MSMTRQEKMLANAYKKKAISVLDEVKRLYHKHTKQHKEVQAAQHSIWAIKNPRRRG